MLNLVPNCGSPHNCLRPTPWSSDESAREMPEHWMSPDGHKHRQASYLWISDSKAYSCLRQPRSELPYYPGGHTARTWSHPVRLHRGCRWSGACRFHPHYQCQSGCLCRQYRNRSRHRPYLQMRWPPYRCHRSFGICIQCARFRIAYAVPPLLLTYIILIFSQSSTP